MGPRRMDDRHVAAEKESHAEHVGAGSPMAGLTTATIRPDGHCVLQTDQSYAILRIGTSMALLVALFVLLSVVSGIDGKRARDEEAIKANPGSSVFFLEEELYVGAKFRMASIAKTGSVTPFAPRRVADAIPFASDSLTVSLRFLGIPQASQRANAMLDTLRQCEAPPAKGEQKFCADSLESLVDGVTSILGPRVNVLETKVSPSSDDPPQVELQEYTVTAIPFRSKPSGHSISCHPQTYAYAVFFCHKTHRTKQFKVFLERKDGTVVDAVAVCHEDTSDWDPEHLSFKALKVKPGETGVCHFVPERHLLWVAEN